MKTYKHGETVYYLRLEKYEQVRVLELRVSVDATRPGMDKGVIMNMNWNRYKSGEFFFMRDLGDEFLGSDPLEVIAAYRQRKIDEIDNDLASLIQRTNKEYVTSST
jgi:hypothetical protein